MKIRDIIPNTQIAYKKWKATRLKKSNASKREEDRLRYKDGEQIDTNADHYKDLK